MRTKRSIAIHFIVVLTVFAASSVGQVKEITEAEYYAAVRAAKSTSETFDRRVTTTTEFFNEGKKTATEIVTEEFQSPDAVRTVQTHRKGKTVVIRETIEIGDAKYIRDDAGIWAKWKRTKSPVYRLAGVIPPGDPKERVIYSVRVMSFKGQTARVFMRISNKAYGFLIGAETQETWINKDNQILKTVLITSEDEPGNIVEKIAAIYDYAPKGLRIEAPIK
jgi:hypothetical protein